VLLDRSLGDPQPPGDPRIGAPLGHQREHVTLALTERGQWVNAPANRHELLHQRGVDDRAPLRDAFERVDEFRYVGDAALE
jgi:hypothetical protein